MAKKKRVYVAPNWERSRTGDIILYTWLWYTIRYDINSDDGLFVLYDGKQIIADLWKLSSAKRVVDLIHNG